jgi:hypothetical protein
MHPYLHEASVVGFSVGAVVYDEPFSGPLCPDRLSHSQLIIHTASDNHSIARSSYLLFKQFYSYLYFVLRLSYLDNPLIPYQHRHYNVDIHFHFPLASFEPDQLFPFPR